MQKIIPNLWFDKNAEEAVNLYISVFNNSRILNVSHYEEAGAEVSGMPEGHVMTVEFSLDGQEFVALNGGPLFTFTPAISFFVNCESSEELNGIWEKLTEGGFVLMELGKYPFSERFGWVQDKFGVNWQLNLEKRREKITPFLMFVGEQCGKAEEAINFYMSLFENSTVTKIERYGKEAGNAEGTVIHSAFLLDGQEFMANDSSIPHPFNFSEAISFLVNCEAQNEVDELWEKLSDGGEKGHCGWLKDKYGVSWQIVPTVLGEMIKDPEKGKRVIREMLQMRKIDISKLKQSYDEK